MLKYLCMLLGLSGCMRVTVPPDFTYKEIPTEEFNISSWQKIGDPSAPYKIYIEGDGNAFNSHGNPTKDPTPKGKLMREIAFKDDSPNVIYLARPCQYIQSKMCHRRYWTNARFAPEVINAEYSAVKQLVGTNPVILVGYSGGAQIAGLLATTKQGLNVKKIITIAGNLNHQAWTQYHNLPPLDGSMNLEHYKTKFFQIPQTHYIGDKDEVIPPQLLQEFIADHTKIILVPKADHFSGWESIYTQVRHAD